ncbi:MAG: bifunctional chorismate mutase/prephenate dehydratase [Clostridiales bacterium]|jgi:chorismate mutase/prephenate dehydratase|nr:bifunctional chorismate mutase/prephenate dehydratase [Clostridiales bacterium]
MSIEDLRKKIDGVDDKIAEDYAERIRLVNAIGELKRAEGIDVLDVYRENKILARLTDGRDAKTAAHIKELYSVIFESSRKIQSEYKIYTIYDELEKMLSKEPPPFPKKLKTACQGARGAFSHIAANKIFKDPEIGFYNTFEEVFKAVESGECEAGVLPIENSTAGSVNEIYDLMRKYKLYIVRSAKIKVEHNLIAAKNARLKDIKEVYSNEQAIAQCGNFLRANGLKAVFAENTAQSVIYVKESGRGDIAAIASKACASIYDMGILRANIQNNDGNYTRFICVTKKLAVYGGANKVSIMVSLPHTNGSLLNFLKKFASYNMTKLESRPVPETEFEFMFYFDFEADLKKTGLLELLRELSGKAYNITFIGNYGEISDLPGNYINDEF